MSQTTPGNGWLLDTTTAPAFSPSPIVLYRELTGRLPSYLFLGESLTAELPRIPALVLTANAGALVNQPFPGPGLEGEPNESPLMTAVYQYSNTNGTNHQVPDPALLNFDGTESFALSVAFRTVSDQFPVSAGAICGKRQSVGDLLGFELTMGTDGSITFTWKDATLVQASLGLSVYNNAAGQHRYADGRWHVFDLEVDVDAQTVAVATEHSEVMSVAWSPASLATATTFRLGGVRGLAAGPHQIAFLAVSTGQQAIKGQPSNTAFVLSEDAFLSVRYGHNNEPIT